MNEQAKFKAAQVGILWNNQSHQPKLGLKNTLRITVANKCSNVNSQFVIISSSINKFN